MIKHVWFDLEGTLTIRSDEFNEAHNQLRYKTYAEVVGKPLTDELKKEFEELYSKHGSNSSVFRSLGYSSAFWQKRFNKLDKAKYYKPMKTIYTTLEKLKEKVLISIFTNLKPDEVQSTLNIIKVNKSWFKFIISGDDVKERKPALDGFHLMIKKSGLPPEEILYVGDRVKVDVIPAKKVGMKTCLVWNKSEEADYSFENFEDILSLF
jgi:putative hydrolase of the HAD superfamily